MVQFLSPLSRSLTSHTYSRGRAVGEHAGEEAKTLVAVVKREEEEEEKEKKSK